MSSPSAPPSTATSSSLSRADSITTMDYLQNNSQGHGHHQRASSGSSANAPSAGQGTSTPANQSSQQEPNNAGTSKTTATSSAATANSPTLSNATLSGAGAKDSNGKPTGAGSEQGRNSSKRAAQNRAAQRAFRQRKDLYVRELERKAELLQVAESQLITLTARNRELEAMFAAQQLSATSSPLPSPLPQQDGYVSGLMGARSEREWDRERDREWSFREHRSFESGNTPYDHFHSSSAPSMRPAIGRHSSAQHLRQAYNASSPSIANGTSIKHLSLNSKLSPYLQHHQRPDSDHEIEPHGRPHRHLHRHPSESSLNLSRTGSFVPPPAEIKEDDYAGGASTYGFRGGPVDARGEMPTSSPSSSYKSGMSGPPHEPSVTHYPNSPLSPTNERMPPYAGHNPRSTGGANSGSMSSPTNGHGDMAYPGHPPTHPQSHPPSSSFDMNKKRPSDSTISWSGSDPYRGPPDGVHHPYHHAVKKQSSWSSLSDQRRLHAVKKQPSCGSIADHRHHWRTRTESPEMSPAEARFGGSAPALPRIPPQFSSQQQSSQPQGSPTTSHQQRPAAAPQQQHGYEREYPSSSPTPFAYSPTGGQAHARQPSDYYNPSRLPPTAHEGNHGPSDMDIVQEGGSNGHGSYSNNSYGRPGEYEPDSYETERDERFGRSDLQHHPQQSPHMGSP